MIYYSHINEDSKPERNWLSKFSKSSMVVVVGSGERVIALMDNPNLVELNLVDINLEAIFLFQLKIQALQILEVKDYLKFIGHYEAGKEFRISCYLKIRNRLTDDCSTYWSQRLPAIERGILYIGHFERFLERIRPLLLFFLGKGFLEILEGKPLVKFSFTAIKWEALSYFFSMKWVYRLFGNKDVAFIGNDSVVGYIPKTISKNIYQGKAGSNFMMHLIFKGHLRDMDMKHLPESLQENILLVVKNKLLNKKLKINYIHGDLLEFAKQLSSGGRGNNFYSCSDILSFQNSDYVFRLIEATANVGENLIVFRSFLANRLTEKDAHCIQDKYGDVYMDDDIESTGMYQVCAVIPKPSLSLSHQS
jgi:S-adenosylmethionine:diacylglycerol 3-amino-3-carboxypropyl transferase